MYRNLSSLLNELSELGVLISDTQDLLKQVPGDTIVEFQLEQLKHRQSELNLVMFLLMQDTYWRISPNTILGLSEELYLH